MSSHDASQFAIELARIAADMNASEVLVMDLRGISPVTDVTVISTGTSDRQMRGLTDAVVEYGKKVGRRPFGLAGYDGGTWIVIDYVDVVFHVFGKAHRDYFDLELLWGDAPKIDWARSESA